MHWRSEVILLSAGCKEGSSLGVSTYFPVNSHYHHSPRFGWSFVRGTWWGFKIIFRPQCAAEVHHHWRPPSFLQPSWADNLEIPILSGYMIHESGTDPYYPFRKASWSWSILRVLTPQRLCSAGGCSFVALLLYSLDTICVTWGPTYSSREAYSLSLIYGLFLEEGISH